MEITAKKMKTTKISLINLMTYISFTDHQKWLPVGLLKKYLCFIYITICFECKFQNFTLKQNQKCKCLGTEIQSMRQVYHYQKMFKTTFFKKLVLKIYDKYVADQQAVIRTQPIINT